MGKPKNSKVKGLGLKNGSGAKNKQEDPCISPTTLGV